MLSLVTNTHNHSQFVLWRVTVIFKSKFFENATETFFKKYIILYDIKLHKSRSLDAKLGNRHCRENRTVTLE